MPFTLTRDAWKKFKTDNNLSKSKAFNKADVGPHIDSLWKACEQYSKAKGWQTFRPLVTKLTDLQKAFAKFIALKEAMGELTPTAKNQIQTWQKQVNDAVFALAKLAGEGENQLRAEDVNALDRRLSEIGIA